MKSAADTPVPPLRSSVTENLFCVPPLGLKKEQAVTSTKIVATSKSNVVRFLILFIVVSDKIRLFILPFPEW